MNLPTLALVLLTWAGDPSETGPILLDFHAEWCGPCRQMRPVIQDLHRAGMPIKSIDIDNAPKLAARYRVDAVPAFVIVDRDGRELARTKGIQPASELTRLFRNAAASLREADPDPNPNPTRDPAESSSSEEEAASDADSDTPRPERIPNPWETVVRIKVHNPPRSIGYGSGTVIHSTPDEALIMTCAHIFSIEGARQQPNPKRYPRRVTVDLFDGRLSGPKGTQVRPTDTNIAAEVIDYDFAADVGLIRIRPGRRIPASPLVPFGWTPRQGQEMTTVGCSQGNDATAWSTRVTTPRIRGLVNNSSYEATECDHAPLQGRSGGGLYTTDGYLAGVCDFAEPHSKKGLYAAPRSMHRILDRNQLAFIYDRRKGREGDTLLASRRKESPADSDRDRNGDIVYRTQNNPFKPISMPDPDLFGIDAPAVASTRQAAQGAPPNHAWKLRGSTGPRSDAALEIQDGSASGTQSAALEIDPAAEGDVFASRPPRTSPPAAQSPTQPPEDPPAAAASRSRSSGSSAWKAKASSR
jgi:thiol-disulfide isomerase/thioredoxin